MGGSDPTVKNITILSNTKPQEDSDAMMGGGIAEEGKEKRKTRKNKKKLLVLGGLTKEGGGSTSPGTMTQLSASHIPGNMPVPDVGVDSSFTQSGRPYAPTTFGPAGLVRIGGAEQPVKVVLGAPKKAASKVHLVAAASHKKDADSSSKRKTARKIRVSMKGLSRKIHRAKKIHTTAKTASLDDIRKALYKAGLIAKVESKAPEDVLRQMYTDFLMLKNRAL